MVDDYKERGPSGHSREGAHLNSQQLWQHVQALYKLKQTNPSMAGGGACLLEEYWQSVACRRGETALFKGMTLLNIDCALVENYIYMVYPRVYGQHKLDLMSF